MTKNPAVAVFRPDDERLESAQVMLDGLGVEPVPDPMLSVEPTGNRPREDADFTVLTSKTGVELAAESGFEPGGTLCAIGDATASALRDAGYGVDIVPETYSSEGMVTELDGAVDGKRVEVARSDHGAAVLLDGLEAAGAYVHETILYRLVRPPEAGQSVERAAAGDLAGALFTSSLTVEHFMDAAREQGIEAAAREGLNDAIVGAIGDPTRETAEKRGIAVDVVPAQADFEQLAEEVVERVAEVDTA